MAQRPVPGSHTSRRVIALRPAGPDRELIQSFADQWQCSLSEAALRLIRAGATVPHQAVPSERVQHVYGLLNQGMTRQQIIVDCSQRWGLNHRQTDQLIKETRASLEQEVAESRPRFLQEQLDLLHTIQARAQNNSSCLA